MILVTRFIDAVDNGSASNIFIYGLSLVWGYYMNVLFIFLLYTQDLRECYWECHDQLSMEAK